MPENDREVLEREVVHDLPREEPDPPDDAAAYLVDALDRQDAETLREVAAYALRRAAWLDRDLEPEELADADEEIVEEVDDASGKGSVVEKKISCGKESCNSCPHGPYRYRQWREGDTVRSKYLGPA